MNSNQASRQSESARSTELFLFLKPTAYNFLLRKILALSRTGSKLIYLAIYSSCRLEDPFIDNLSASFRCSFFAILGLAELMRRPCEPPTNYYLVNFSVVTVVIFEVEFFYFSATLLFL